MENFEWSWFEEWDDSTLIPINLTAREMALLRSAVSLLQNPFVWSDFTEYYADVVPTLETILVLIADDSV